MKHIALIGLGKMGSSLALNMIDHGWDVVGYNRTKEKTDALVEKSGDKLIPAYSYEEIMQKINKDGARYIWIMLPAGEVVDEVIKELVPHLREDDMIIDGGNGFYKDAIRRYAELKKKKIRFMDVGVSGGPEGARHGTSMMIGGDKENFEELDDLFEDLNVEDGYAFFEGPGAGHFVKMVHNGIEYGMMEAIAEGFALLESCNETVQECTYDIDLKKAARVYAHGSVIESRLLMWLEKAFREWGSDLEPVSGKANQLGEGRWTAEVADVMGVSADAIKDAIKAREDSQRSPNFAGKIVQAMRGQFGGHPVLKDQTPTKTGEKAKDEE